MISFLGMVFALWVNRARFVRVLAPTVVAATVVAAAVMQPHIIGPEAPAVATESVELTLAPASFDNRWRAGIEGRYGSNLNGDHTLLPANADGDTDYYLWWSHDSLNLDPGDHVAALSGATGIEVALGSGNITADSRASSTCTAINSAAIANWSCSANSGVVTLTGTIDAASVATGGAYTARGAAGLFGNHTTAVLTNGNPFNSAIAVHGTFTDGPAILTSLCILLGTAEDDDTVRLGLYTGGAFDDLTGTTLQAECTTVGSGSGYACCQLDAAATVSIADNASVWLVAEADQDDDNPADGTTTHPAFSALGGSQEDWTDRNLVIFSDTVDADPSTAMPSSLAGATTDETNAVAMMASFETRALPLVGDGSLGGTTTNGLVLGVHTDAILAASESALTSPDPGGANVFASLTTPSILGMVMTRSEVAAHDISSGQFRLAEYIGGAIGDPDGATLLQDHGQVSGSASMAWVGINASPEVAIPASTVMHLGTRGNGGVAIGFAANASPDAADPADDPSDFGRSNSVEYETNTANAALSTDDADPYETPFATDPGDDQPTNFPGRGIRWRVAGDTVTVP